MAQAHTTGHPNRLQRPRAEIEFSEANRTSHRTLSRHKRAGHINRQDNRQQSSLQGWSSRPLLGGVVPDRMQGVMKVCVFTWLEEDTLANLPRTL